MAHNQALGQFGEEQARFFLTDAGCTIVKTHFRTRYGEIDIIARDGDALCFVEVKTRTNRALGDPREAITEKKEYNARVTAQIYLSEHPDCAASEVRFDVVEVIAPSLKKQPHIEWIKDAF